MTQDPRLKVRLRERWPQAIARNPDIAYLRRLADDTKYLSELNQVVLDTKIDEEVKVWMKRLGEVSGRNPYLWPWVRTAVELASLSCIDIGLYNHVNDTKVLLVMICTLIDDVADEHGERRLLNQLLRILTDRAAPGDLDFKENERKLAACLHYFVETFYGRLATYPRYQEFSEILSFDMENLAGAFRYASMLNANPTVMNLVEHDLFQPHNMCITIASTIDLTASPGFDRMELGLLRSAVNTAAYMGRIGNLLTTWKREVGQRDYTSGVFARAVETRALELSVLTSAALHPERNGDIVQAIEHSDAEDFFYRRWLEKRSQIAGAAPQAKSISLNDYLDGFERLICFHLASRGKK